MALIKCEECGKEISDKAKNCVNCGCPIEKELLCNECGNKLDKNDKTCKCCGCPIKSKSKEENNNISTFTKIWLIICIILCFLISGINFFNIYIIGNPPTNIMGILALMLGVSYILLLKNTNKKNFAMLVAINILVFVYNMFSYQMLISLFYVLCAITNTLITFIVIRKSINNTNFDIKKNIPVLVIFIILLGLILIFPKSYNLNDYSEKTNNPTHERIELNDYNLENYVIVNLSGALRDYSSSYFKSVYFSGSITPSRYDLQCENVRFKLTMSVSYNSTNGRTRSNDYTETIRLDSGCNANIVNKKQLSDVAKSVNNYTYSVSNVSGNIIVPKISVE